MTFTRTSHAWASLHEDGRELEVLVLEVRVVLSELGEGGASKKHPSDAMDREAALGEDGLAAKEELPRSLRTFVVAFPQ